MPANKWEELYGGPVPMNLPPVAPNVTPRVDDPECPRDCSGRHGVDGLIKCAHCHIPGYQDWWHEYKVNRGVNFHLLKPVNGAPALLSPHMPCPICGGQFSK